MQKARSVLPNHLVLAILLLLAPLSAIWAQSCSGSFGDPVVNITFGSGSNPGPSLKAAATGYSYTSNGCPEDGYYTLANNSVGCHGSTWHNVSSDHTGNPQGYFMVINASYTPSDFYLDTVKGLCAGTTYRFGAWIANMLIPSACNSSGIQPNITLSIESTTGTKLQSLPTGNIAANSSMTWTQYSMDFTVPVGYTDIVLRMTNNSAGGCGNDLALDDITFSPCGPQAQAGITGGTGTGDAMSFCLDAQTTISFNGSVSAGYTNPNEQWQVSTDTGKTWTDLVGATGLTYTRPPSTLPGFYQYRMAVGDGGNVLLPTCRVASNIISVTVWPKPQPLAINNGPLCERDTLRLSADDPNAAQDIYNWTGPNGFSATNQQTPTINTITPAAAGLYTVTVTNGGGCSNTGQTTAIINPAPSAAFITTDPPCEKTSLNFADQSTTTGQTITQWAWTFGDGSTESVQNPAHTYASAGAYNVSLVVTTDKACTNLPLTQTITVHDRPYTYFGMPEVCLADPASAFLFTDSSTIADATAAGFTYAWNFDDGASNPGNPNTSTLKNPTHHYAAPGPFLVQLTVTSANGCKKDTTQIFSVNGSNPQAVYDIAPAILCSNQPIVLTDRSTVAPGNIVRTEIYWDYLHDPGIHTDEETPVPGQQYSHAYPDFSSPATQSYDIRYIVYSGQTCMNQSATTITVNASPQTSFDALDPVCEEITPYPITAGHETQGFTGIGTYFGRGITADGTFTPRIARPGVDTLHYAFMASNGCTDTSTQTIRVYPQPRADAGRTQYFLEGGELYLQGSGSGNNISYAWTPADSIIGDSHIPDPKASPHEDITYTLTVTSSDGCTDSSSVLIVVLKVPVVPNAFSPNGDGINDTWIIRYLDSYPGAEIQVFNRYGQTVYHVIGYSRPWDGTYNGNPLPIGTYYWIIDPKNGRKRFSGSVTIIR